MKTQYTVKKKGRKAREERHHTKVSQVSLIPDILPVVHTLELTETPCFCLIQRHLQTSYSPLLCNKTFWFYSYKQMKSSCKLKQHSNKSIYITFWLWTHWRRGGKACLIHPPHIYLMACRISSVSYFLFFLPLNMHWKPKGILTFFSEHQYNRLISF